MSKLVHAFLAPPVKSVDNQRKISSPGFRSAAPPIETQNYNSRMPGVGWGGVGGLVETDRAAIFKTAGLLETVWGEDEL